MFEKVKNLFGKRESEGWVAPQEVFDRMLRPSKAEGAEEDSAEFLDVELESKIAELVRLQEGRDKLWEEISAFNDVTSADRALLEPIDLKIGIKKAEITTVRQLINEKSSKMADVA